MIILAKFYLDFFMENYTIFKLPNFEVIHLFLVREHEIILI